MQKQLLWFVVIFFLAFGFVDAKAQSSEPKFDAVGQVTWLRANVISSGGGAEWRPGGGGLFSYTINKNISVEAAVFGLSGRPPVNTRDELPSPKLQGLFGVKVGVKKDSYGVFGKFRPGVTRFTPSFNCDEEDFNSCEQRRRIGFTADYGGVFELYPQRHLVIRADAGWTYTHYPERRVFIPNEGSPTIPFPGVFRSREGFGRHYFQFAVGAGFRF